MALGYVIVIKNADGEKELHHNAHGPAFYKTYDNALKVLQKNLKQYEKYAQRTSNRQDYWKNVCASYKDAVILEIK